jgi:hypothetical protein
MFRKSCVLGLVLTLSLAPAWARRHKYKMETVPLTPQQQQLIHEAIQQEQVTIRAIEKDTPVVQTYIQDMRPDPKLYQVPVKDEYSIARVDFSKGFDAYSYNAKQTKTGLLHGTLKYLSDLTKSFHLTDNPTGFMDMMFIDPSGFNERHYTFSFVRQEFLGEIRTSVFDVRPKKHTGPGRFFGRIWVEDNGGHIVRFNGTYTNNPNDPENHYYHFDSWRQNIQPGIWMPLAIYVEETHRTESSKSVGLRGQTFYWGYSLKTPPRTQEQESVDIENAQDQSQNATDLSPLQAERQWVVEAQNNVLDRLQAAGLLAAPSPFDKVLDQVVENVVIGNNLALPGPIHCRVLLTEPLETLAVGNTILISKGLVDVLPTEADLAAVLSFQLAQIELGHHIDTRYAFSDRLLFPDEAAFQKIEMSHSTADNASAAKKAEELFAHSVYAPKAGEVGLFFEQLMGRQKALKQLLTPRLGDPLLQADGQPWMASFLNGAPKLDMANLQQVAALPLDSHLKIDPWTDQVQTLNVSPAPLLNASDKMPFEITPVYFRLEPYQAPAAPQAAPAQGADQNQGQTQGAAAGAGQNQNTQPAQNAPAAQQPGPVQEQNLPDPGQTNPPQGQPQTQPQTTPQGQPQTR